MPSPVPPPVVLTVAGSDNSAGAGAQADLKTFTAHGHYGLTAVTCVVAEVPGRVGAVLPVPEPVVREQIDLLFDAFPIAALKTGMLFSRSLIEAVADRLAARRIGSPEGPPLVVDPVMVATSGDPLLQPDAIETYRARLFPLAALITPNLDEARVLLGHPVAGREAMASAALELRERCGTAVLLKGGHFGGPEALDLLADREGRLHRFAGPYYEGVETHGTGCTYSAAITAGLALGLEPVEAVARAKRFVSDAIRDSFAWTHGGRRTCALNHALPAPGTDAFGRRL